MFTGIIECLGKVTALKKEGGNITFTIVSDISKELKIDQSIAHNGTCLTVVACDQESHEVTAIDETLVKTNLGELKEGDIVNLERCMVMGGRLDGHVVQGHVDQIAICVEKKDEDGSWRFTFEYDSQPGNVTVEKGSICINGVSLTVVGSQNGRFSVAIIPYTYDHTVFSTIEVGDKINLEFDILGKYVQKLLGNSGLIIG